MTNKGNKEGKKLIQLWVSVEKWKELEQAAASVEEPITGWCRRALYASLRRWEKPVLKVAYEKCTVCGKKHNEQDHYNNE